MQNFGLNRNAVAKIEDDQEYYSRLDEKYGSKTSKLLTRKLSEIEQLKEKKETAQEKKVVDLQSEYARKYNLDHNKSFLKAKRSVQEKEGLTSIEINNKMQFPKPLPDPEAGQYYQTQERV